MHKRMTRPLKTKAGTVFPLRIPGPQYDRIAEAATLSGDSIAAFIRVAAIKAADKALKRAA